RRADPIRTRLPELPLVLPHCRAARRVTVLAKAIRLVGFDTRKSVLRGFSRPPCEQHSLGAEAPAHVLGGQPALLQSEFVVCASGHRVIALAWIEWSFDDA